MHTVFHFQNFFSVKAGVNYVLQNVKLYIIPLSSPSLTHFTSAKYKQREMLSIFSNIIHLLSLGKVSSMCHINTAEVTVFMLHIMLKSDKTEHHLHHHE